MTDAHLVILVSAIASAAGSLVAALKWSVSRISKTIDNNTLAMLANTKSNARLEVKIEALADWAEGHPTPALGVPIVTADPPRQVHRPTPPPPPAPNSRTPVRGNPLPPLPRGKTRNEDR